MENKADLIQRLARLSPKQLAFMVLELQEANEAQQRRGLEPIALVGMGCRFPGGRGLDGYWRVLRDGVDAIGEVPADRWHLDTYYDPDPETPGKMYTRWGGFVDDADRFDPQFFGISRREAETMDPQQRLTLEVAWEALEHGGIAPAALMRSRAGVFVGVSGNDYAARVVGSGATLDGYVGTGNAPSVVAGRVAYVLGAQGPAMSVDTACSSSLVAIHLASQALRNAECDLALAGGVSVILAPETNVILSRAGMMARDGRCKTFDASADGYVRGEGCGIVVLRRLSDAVRDGNRVLAVIRGTAVNQDGRSNGLTAPNGQVQQDLLREALQRSGVEPAAIHYVEAHGTGTSLGDPIELQALAAVLGPGHTSERPLRIGSAKTNIGHLEAAAGVAGLIKVVLAMQHEQIAPQLHFQKPNPHVAWERMPIAVVTEAVAWPRGGELRRAGVSSFGFSGTNAHVIVEEAPAAKARGTSVDRPQHVLTLSARSDAALQDLAARYDGYLAETADPLGDVCFTANTGRSAFPERAAIVGGSTADVRDAIRVWREGGSSPRVFRGRAGASAPGIVFMFTGQGAQYAGMARALYETHPIFRDALDECDRLLRGQMERPLHDVLYRTDEPLVDSTAYTQPALFAIEYALTELWRSWGVSPAAVIGHSVGEFAAAYAAGVLTLTDALTLVAARARLMQQLPAGGAMASLSADAARIAPLLYGDVAIAALNAPDSTVISGSQNAVDDVLSRAAAIGIRHQRLTVSHAFHSPLVDPMLDAFEAAASAVAHAAPRIAYASNLTGAIVQPGFTFDAGYWRRHAREAVRFADGISALYAQGHRVFLEIGPSATLLALGQRSVPTGGQDATWLASLRRGRDDWEQLGGALASLYVQGAAIDWAAVDRPYDRRLVSLPTYPFQRERFWIDPPARRGAQALPADADHVRDGGLLYDVQWEPAESAAAATAAGTWIVLPDRQGIARRVQAEFARQGGRCEIADPDGTADLSFEDLGDVRGVLDFRMLDADAAADLPGALTRVARSFASTPGARRRRVWIVTRGAQPAGAGAQIVSAAQAAVWGLGRVAAIEQPEAWGGLIDLDPRSEDAGAAAMVSGLLAFDGEDQVAYRAGRRFVARLRPAEQPPSSRIAPSPAGTYLVTGGTGALGVQLTRRLIDRGARRVVLMSRSGQRPAQLATLEDAGAAVLVAQGDVASRDDVARVLGDIQKTGFPLRGIVHAAGIVRSVAVAELGANDIDQVLRAKTVGTEVLLDAVRDLPLDFVVLFSSVSSIWGSKGLAAYAAANHFLDAVAHRRRATGLPALSVNWGPWADGGMTSDDDRQWLAQLGLDALAPADALDRLEELIVSGVTQATVARVDWTRFVSVYTAKARRPLLEALASPPVEDRPAGELSAPVDLMALGDTERVAELEARLLNAAAAVLRCSPSEIDPDAPLNQLGLDSLVGVELRNRVQRDTGVLLPVVSILDGASVRSLAALALDKLGQADRPVAVRAATLAAEEAQALLGRISELDDAEVERLLASLAPDSSPY